MRKMTALLTIAGPIKPFLVGPRLRELSKALACRTLVPQYTCKVQIIAILA